MKPKITVTGIKSRALQFLSSQDGRPYWWNCSSHDDAIFMLTYGYRRGLFCTLANIPPITNIIQ